MQRHDEKLVPVPVCTHVYMTLGSNLYVAFVCVSVRATSDVGPRPGESPVPIAHHTGGNDVIVDT